MSIGAQWTPTHSGYQLVRYATGEVALVAYDTVKGWEWGNTTPPSGQVASVQNVGEHPFGSTSRLFETAIATLPSKIKQALTKIGSENGVSNPSGAIILNSKGAMTAGGTGAGSDTGQAPWTAKTLPGESGGNTNPLISSSLTSFLGDLLKGATWLRVAEFIGGLILLIFALFMLGHVVDGGSSGGTRTRVVPV